MTATTDSADDLVKQKLEEVHGKSSTKEAEDVRDECNSEKSDEPVKEKDIVEKDIVETQKEDVKEEEKSVSGEQKETDVDETAKNDADDAAEDAIMEDEKSDIDEDFDTECETIPVDTMRLNPYDASLNALHSQCGQQMFTALSEHLNQLFAGMRANVGFKSGRYYFEMKLLDAPRWTRIGFSQARSYIQPDDTTTAGALSTHLLDDETSFGFDAMGTVYTCGVKSKDANPKWSRTDIIGVLLDIPKRQISLFLNGTKTPTGQVTTIPAHFYKENSDELIEPLFPTCAVKQSAVECNFSHKVWKDLPFAVRTVSHAKTEDVVYSKMVSNLARDSKAFKNQTVKVVIPVGFEVNKVIHEYSMKHPDAMVLTQDALHQWAEKSHNTRRGTNGKYNLHCVDQPNIVFPMLLNGKRTYLYSFSTYNNMHPKARKDALLKLKHGLNVEITALVSTESIMDGCSNSNEILPVLRDMYESLSLPDECEGFDNILFSNPEDAEACVEKFETWKKDCKLKSRIPASELKKSTYFQDRMQEFFRLKGLQHKSSGEQVRAKLQAEKAEAKAKADAEQPEEEEILDDPAAMEEDLDFPDILTEWSEEDWMLAELRCELHALLHVFKKDVNDSERMSFPVLHFGYYYQIYANKPMQTTLSRFSCKTHDDLLRLVPEICQHTESVDEFSLRKTNESLIADYDLVLPVHDEEVAVSEFITITETARQTRTDMLDAGDENAALTFSYKNMSNGNAAAAQRRTFSGENSNFPNQRNPSRNNTYDAYNGTKRHRGNSGQVSSYNRR